MVNQEFQELKRQWGVNSTERARIIKEMRDNLLKRNSGSEKYSFEYIQQGVVISILDCEVEELLKIDGDMNPQGK